ncbi:MAG: riboflavin biosynthesis protein RibF [Ruminococcus sp.]|nr:riboflavin biosynthesis protein RibF [Ruminococcus sp.]
MKDITQTGIVTDEGCAVALGIFDGVHRGHRQVLDKAFSHSELSKAVFTFNTHTVDSKGKDYKMLITDSFKKKLLQRAGADYIYSPDFYRLKSMPAEDFARDILKGALHAEVAVCGEKFRFGHNAAGDSDALIRFGRKYGFSVEIVERLDYDGVRISSSLIRKLVGEGDIARANELLGYSYGYCLEVIHGNEIGRTWDFPTINQLIPDGLVMPKFGVYVSRVHIGDKYYAGVTNIGVKPTVEKEIRPLAETYIIGYEGDLYGREIEIELFEFIRPERKFESFDALKAEINRNTEYAKKAYSRQHRTTTG